MSALRSEPTTKQVGAAERARQLSDLIAAHCEHGEQHARLAPEVVEACRAAGLFALTVPEEVGGLEAPLVDAVRALDIVASVDPAVAWYMMNSVPLGRMVARVDRRHWKTVLAQPLGNFGYSVVPGQARAVDDGYLLSGDWPLMTGVDDADWCVVFCLVREPAAEHRQLRVAFLPTAELEVDRIWNDAVAMRGTGSHRVLVEDAFVPSELMVDPNGPPLLDRTLYRCPTMAAAGVINAAIATGILGSAVEAVGAELRGKRSATSNQKASENISLLELLATAGSAVWNLRAGTEAAAIAVWEAAERNEELEPETGATAVGAMFEATRIARSLISEIYSRSSKAAFFHGHPLERALRNIHAVAYAIETLRFLQHDQGRVHMGLKPLIPAFPGYKD